MLIFHLGQKLFLLISLCCSVVCRLGKCKGLVEGDLKGEPCELGLEKAAARQEPGDNDLVISVNSVNNIES